MEARAFEVSRLRLGEETMPTVSPDSVSEPARSAAVDTAAIDTARDSDDHVHSPERRVPAPAPTRDPKTMADAGELLRALAAPVRIAIVLQLRVAERCVHELVDALSVTQPLISQHLRVLKSVGIVYGERHGREVVYRLVDEHLAHIVVDALAHAEETGAARRHASDNDSGQETETA
jgi:ArsR family transcriptional regulator